MRVLFSGSFKFFDEMKKLRKELALFGIKCILPKFALGNFSAWEIEKIKENRKKHGLQNGEFEKIIKVKKWFFNQLRNCDAMIVFDIDGYIGLSVAAEIGAIYILEKPVFFLEKPKDVAIQALLEFSKNFKIVPPEKLIDELRKLKL